MDRWNLSFVRDWILAFHRSAFNLADVAIFAGLLGYLLVQNKRLQKKNPLT
jgi:lipoprotein signal peptidase